MVIDDVAIEVEVSCGRKPVTAEVLVFSVRPKSAQTSRRARCRSGYDPGDGIRRWRALDVGIAKAYLQAAVPQVQCAEHGVLL